MLDILFGFGGDVKNWGMRWVREDWWVECGGVDWKCEPAG